jgi:CubicO group peptidase (beta-lactamase class C family)
MNDPASTSRKQKHAVRESYDTGRLEQLLDGLLGSRGIHHAVLAVESMDGSFSWAGTRGSANAAGTPMEAHHPYFVASIDKLMTAVVILKLHEQGRVNIESGIGEYLPAGLVSGLSIWKGEDLSATVTVRNLLAHTSGLANYLEDKPKSGPRLMESITTTGDRALDIEGMVRVVREEMRPHFPPQPAAARRQRIRYSDTNYVLLRAIAESVAGKPMHEILESMVFEPLGMSSTWVAGSAKGGLPEPATLWFGDAPLDIPLAMESIKAVYSTAGDQLRFMKAVVTGEVFDDAGTYRLMTSRWNRFSFPLDPAAMRAPSWPIEYGLGIKRFRLPRWLSGSAPMPALFGHSGSTGTWLFHCPDLDLVLAGTIGQVTAGAVPYRFLPKVLAELRRA